MPSPLWARALPSGSLGLRKAGSKCFRGRLHSRGLWSYQDPAG